MLSRVLGLVVLGLLGTDTAFAVCPDTVALTCNSSLTSSPTTSTFESHSSCSVGTYSGVDWAGEIVPVAGESVAIIVDPDDDVADGIAVFSSQEDCGDLGTCVGEVGANETLRFVANGDPYFVVVDESSGDQEYEALVAAVCAADCTPEQVHLPLTCSSERTLSADLGTALFDRYSCHPSLGQVGPELIFSFEPQVTGTAELMVTDFAIDLDVFLLADRCNATECIDYDTRGGSLDVTLTFEAVAGTTYYLVVERYNSQQTNYTVSSSVGPDSACREHCDDQTDNDGDGDVDCLDLDCAASLHCTGGCDVDGDGFIHQACGGGDCDDGVADSGDSDSDGVPDVCDNCGSTANPSQTDVDQDGLGDACDEEICDGLDNDRDGVTDEDSPDSDEDGIADCVDVPEDTGDSGLETGDTGFDPPEMKTFCGCGSVPVPGAPFSGLLVFGLVVCVRRRAIEWRCGNL